MVKILARQRNGIKICHINAQSLNNKIDELRLTFENSCVDMVCVSETWLNDHTPDSLILLRGYKVFRNDRKTRGGGVAIYVRQGIKCKLVHKSAAEEKIEQVFIEVTSNGEKLLIGCVYRPYNNISFESLNKKLEEIAPEYSDIIIAGDFNSNLLCESTLKDNMSVFGLLPTNTTMPTHFSMTNNTLLDLSFVSDISKVQLYDQLTASCFSNHDLIFISYNFLANIDDETSTCRDFKNIDFDALYENFNLVDWDKIFYMHSVAEQAKYLEENINKLYEMSVPLKTITNHFKARPWFNTTIKGLIYERDSAYSRWKRFKIDAFREDFRQARSIVNKEIDKAKSLYYSNRFSRSLKAKDTWNTIRAIGHCNKTVSHDFQNSANEINEKFLNIPTVVPNHNFYDDIFINYLPPNNNFEFECVTQTDVMSSCLAVNSNATGCDNVDPKFVKLILPSLLPYLTHLYNSILTTSCFPKRWLHAKIIPLPKSQNEYRPIAILPFLSKVLEKLMYSQMFAYLNKFDYLSKFQSGFRPKHSCITALIDVTEDLRRELDEGKLGILVLLDHSKAFDTVDHALLSSKLRYFFNFTNTAIKLILSYLENRSQAVFLKNEASDPLAIARGVPQGSILGPLLFSCYVNDLKQQLKYCKFHMYADDVQIYCGAEVGSLKDTVGMVNSDLQNVYRWASANGLSLNPQKSKCLILRGRTWKCHFDLNIVLNDEKIEIVEKVKNLGIIFNSTLTWSDHVNSIAGTIYSKLRALWSTQCFTPQHIRLLLAKTYLMPSLLYGCELFYSCDSVSRQRLNVLFNNVCRYVYRKRKFDHITPHVSALYGVSIENLFKIRALTLLHKIVHYKSPSYLFDRISFARSNRGQLLIPFKQRRLVSEWQYYIQTIRLWNTLPHSIQTISNTNHFKNYLFNFFSSSYNV